MFCLGRCSSKGSKEPEPKNSKMEQLLNQRKKEISDCPSQEAESLSEEHNDEPDSSDSDEKEPVTTPIDELTN